MEGEGAEDAAADWWHVGESEGAVVVELFHGFVADAAACVCPT
jgi:hypothetical protein